MTPHLHWPRPFRRRREARSSTAPALVVFIAALSVLAGVGQVAGVAPRPALRVSEAAPAAPDDDAQANREDGLMAARLVDLPPASVDAISL